MKYLNDNDLIKKAQNNDILALEHLIYKYKNFVKSRTRSYFLIGGDKEDIIQEGMIGIYKAIIDYDESKGNFYSFAQICVDRQIITAIKKANRKKHSPLNTSISLDLNTYDKLEKSVYLLEILKDNTISSPEDFIINKEQFKLIQKNIKDSLSDFEMQVLYLYLDGRSYTEISTYFSKDCKSIDNALQRIKKKIEKLLDI